MDYLGYNNFSQLPEIYPVKKKVKKDANFSLLINAHTVLLMSSFNIMSNFDVLVLSNPYLFLTATVTRKYSFTTNVY